MEDFAVVCKAFEEDEELKTLAFGIIGGSRFSFAMFTPEMIFSSLFMAIGYKLTNLALMCNSEICHAK